MTAMDLEKGCVSVEISQEAGSVSDLESPGSLTDVPTSTTEKSLCLPWSSVTTEIPQSSLVKTSSHSTAETVLTVQTDPELVKPAARQSTKPVSSSPYDYATTYRKIFAVIFTANIATLIALMVKANGIPDSQAVGSATSANLMVCVLFRQEDFVNLLYELFTCAPHSTPLCIRKRLAKVFHYGGCHSGAGTAAVVWYLIYAALVILDHINNPQTDLLVNMIASWMLVLLFFVMLAAAHPSLRRKFHDYFEAAHRFAGWIALVAFWIHNVFSARVVARQLGTTVSHVLPRSPNFWFICVTTCCTILSWSRLRRRTVYPERLSGHATRLHFKHRPMAPFYGIKLSDRPLTQWHAFATIPNTDPGTGKIVGFSVLVSNAGDWTRKQIELPDERKLWIRGAPLHGLLYTSRLFKRIVVVATGSGIGPCLSLMFADVTPRRILWSTQNPESTYGPDVVAAVKKSDPNAVIWNTSKRGYPDIVNETYQLVLESDAEAVFIISNPKVTRKVVLGMNAQRVPAYGAIFDS